MAAWPCLPFAAVGEAHVRICAAAGVNDSDARCAPRGEAARQPELQSEPDRAEPRPGDPYETPAPERVASFQAIVRRAVPCFVRKPRGLDIYGGVRAVETQRG